MNEVITRTETDNQESHYLDPERFTYEETIQILEHGQVANIRQIEEALPSIIPHADRVLLGDLHPKPHKDNAFLIEISSEKGILPVIYKPESGINKGGMIGQLLPVPTHPHSSHHQKEAASSMIDRELGFDLIPATIVRDDLPEGVGSLRPFIEGETYASGEPINTQFMQMAVLDYIIGQIDRKNENIVISDKTGRYHAIDNSLTCFEDGYINRFEKKGPRLRMGYDNKTDPPKFKNADVPSDILKQVKEFVSREPEIREKLQKHLTSNEIDAIMKRAKIMAGTYDSGSTEQNKRIASLTGKFL